MSALYAMSEQPTKRRRNDLESSHTRPVITNHDLLYFENGNIVILSLPQDNVVTAFKVYKDHLLINSPVFEGMLSVPLPPNMEKHDNAPVVRLYDEAKDLVPFLKAVYDPTSIPSKRDFYGTTCHQVESIFKLSKKYQFDKLLTCMRYTLSTIWPRALLLWDISHPTFFEDAPHPEVSLPEPCAAIRLARDYDIPEILPVAFYHLLRILPDAFCYMEAADGGPLSCGNSFVDYWVNLALLSRHDFVCVIRGSMAIRGFIDDLHSRATIYWSQRRADCNTVDTCIEPLAALVMKHIAAMHRSGGDVLELLQKKAIRPLKAKEICDNCLRSYIEYMEDEREEFWSRLPAFFGLEGSGFTVSS